MSNKIAERVILFSGLIYGAVDCVVAILYWNIPNNSFLDGLHSLFDGGLRDYFLFMAYVMIFVLFSKIDKLEKKIDEQSKK